MLLIVHDHVANDTLPSVCNSVVDLHALTSLAEPQTLRNNTYDILSTLMACGLDHKKCTLFAQSHVSST